MQPGGVIRDAETKQYQKKSHMTNSRLYHDEQLPVASRLTDMRNKHHSRSYENKYFADDESQMPHEAT